MAEQREPLMSVAEIGAYLGVSRQTVRRLFERHELRGVRIGHQWRARAEDVEQLATPADATPHVALRHEMSHPSPTSTPALGDGPSYRLFRERPWETEKRPPAVTEGR